jgi:hypothetical protein
MSKKNWPYPVLDPQGEDYPHCAFQASVDITQTRKTFVGSVRMDMGSDTLKNAIDDGNAVYMLQLHCPRTSFRSVARSREATFDFELPESSMREDFTVQPFLISEGAWELSSTEFSPTFKGLRFPIEKGYVLAVAPQLNYTAEKRLDDLKSVRAIFFVNRNPAPEKQLVEFDFLHDRIGIYLSNDDYNNYRIFRSRTPFSQMFVCSLVLPALQQALMAMSATDSGDSAGPRWQRVIRRCLKDCGEVVIDKDRTFEIAQKLLEMPISRAFVAINVSESDSEE